MRVRLKRVDTDLPLPRYESGGAVGFDLTVRQETVVPSKGIALIPGNVIVEVPEGYALVVASRSSTPQKHGLLKPHGIGVIDRDYCGPADEIMIQVYNMTDAPVTVPRGARIAQGLFVRVDKADFEEADDLKKPDRGGFGSTGA